ncbi:hypothetical protein CAPTEDRAFT_210894 [Capitella teleta]|uniref:Uncharacterized protein n=1 Tax=Capitella teleta TaxID=283909 RepID=R7T6W2_CAPTE|nr:hypothetical protein CAPTEDRAFT_210894 [Capitella teleta]|eukprot:ELT89260.1 hypothetical protein CAPTEDRAFT_210894 [Capitella teleta]
MAATEYCLYYANASGATKQSYVHYIRQIGTSIRANETPMIRLKDVHTTPLAQIEFLLQSPMTAAVYLGYSELHSLIIAPNEGHAEYTQQKVQNTEISVFGGEALGTQARKSPVFGGECVKNFAAHVLEVGTDIMRKYTEQVQCYISTKQKPENTVRVETKCYITGIPIGNTEDYRIAIGIDHAYFVVTAEIEGNF